jgi:hypothetical protein
MVEFKQELKLQNGCTRIRQSEERDLRQTHQAAAACTLNGYDILLKPFSQEADKASYSKNKSSLHAKVEEYRRTPPSSLYLLGIDFAWITRSLPSTMQFNVITSHS